MKEANFVPFIVPGVWDADMQTFAKPQEISAICIHQPEFSDTQDIKDMNHICTFFKLWKNFDSDDVHDSWTFSVFCKCIFLCSDTSVKVWNGLRTFGWTNKVLESRTPLPKTKYSLAIVSLSHCSHSDNTSLDTACIKSLNPPIRRQWATNQAQFRFERHQGEHKLCLDVWGEWNHISQC